MAVLESGEMYLETIYVLKNEKGMEKVRAIDIGQYMNFSKPSVSRALKLLKEENQITVDSEGYISFTESGKKIAEKIYERHVILTKIFTKLGISNETASNDACKIEHDLSDETFNAIKKHFESNK